MIAATSFRFSKIVVVESLEDHEVKTGRITADYVKTLDRVIQQGTAVELIECGYASEFEAIIETLIAQSLRGDHVPLLHVECHGDRVLGLEFANGSTMPWHEVSRLLTKLNLATKFNLFAVFSACFGGYFLKQLSSVSAAPCYAMVAPTEAVDPAEILGPMRMFYSVLFRVRDAGEATEAMSKSRLSVGQWFSVHAEVWFERVTISYVKNHCNRKAVRVRTRRMYRELLAEGKRQSIGFLKRALLKANRAGLTDEHFKKYFMVHELPENAARFASAKRRVERRMAELRSTRRYLV